MDGELCREWAASRGDQPMTLRELEYRLTLWHRLRYAGKPVDPAATLRKLTEELREFADEVLAHLARGDADAGRRAAVEAADVLFVLVQLVRACGGSLADAAAYKLDVIERRLTDPAAGRDRP